MAEDKGGLDIKNLPFQDRLKYFNSQDVVDISNGMSTLIRNSDELMDFTINKLIEAPNQSRFPILGFKDGTILMLGGKNERFEHRQILLASGMSLGDIQFATGMEGLDSSAEMPYLELTASREVQYMKPGDKTRIYLAKDTDMNVPGGSSIANQRGVQFLEKVFGNMEGVTVNTPPVWSLNDPKP